MPLGGLLEGKRLANGLAVVLVNPLRRTVGRNHNQRHMGIVSLGSRRRQIEQRRPRSAHHSHRLLRLLGDANGNVARRTLVNHHHLAQSLFACKRHEQRRVAATRTANRPSSAAIGKHLRKPSAGVVRCIRVIGFHCIKITDFFSFFKTQSIPAGNISYARDALAKSAERLLPHTD